MSGRGAGSGDGSDPTSDHVDFVDHGDGRGDDGAEELPQHASRVDAWRSRAERFLRGRYGLPTVVVVVVLALLVGRALLHDRSDGAPATPTRSTTDGPTSDTDTGRGVTLPLRTGPEPTRCPGLQCYTSSSSPSTVRAAVRATFPQATVTAAETIRLVDRAQADPLWFRELDVRVGTATLTVRVQAHAAGDTPDGGAKDDGHASVTYVDAPLRQWFVELRMTDRSGTKDTFDQLSALVDDPRLLAVPT